MLARVILNVPSSDTRDAYLAKSVWEYAYIADTQLVAQWWLQTSEANPEPQDPKSRPRLDTEFALGKPDFRNGRTLHPKLPDGSIDYDTTVNAENYVVLVTGVQDIIGCHKKWDFHLTRAPTWLAWSTARFKKCLTQTTRQDYDRNSVVSWVTHQCRLFFVSLTWTAGRCSCL